MSIIMTIIPRIWIIVESLEKTKSVIMEWNEISFIYYVTSGHHIHIPHTHTCKL